MAGYVLIVTIAALVTCGLSQDGKNSFNLILVFCLSIILSRQSSTGVLSISFWLDG